MSAFYIAMIAPALWAVTNHLDKYILSRYFKTASVGAMMIFSALIGLFVFPVALLLQQGAFSVSPVVAVLTAVNGCLYLVATLPYLKALKISEASVTIPMFQVIPVIHFVLARFILDEILTVNQMVGGLLVVVGAIIISLEMQAGKKFKLRGDVLGLMFLSSFIFALNFLMFKVFAIETELWTTVMWESVGFVLFGVLMLLVVKTYRKDFISVFRNNGKILVGINVLNEVINIVAKLIFNYASLLIAIALASAASGFQPVFVLLYSVILARFWPHISKEQVFGRHLTQKLLAIGIMLIGGYIINFL